MTLPVRLAKRIAGACCYSGCPEPAIDGSDYCGPHDAHERARAANRQKRHREKLAKAGLCLAGCGRKVSRRRKPDGAPWPRRCPGCRRRHVQQLRDKRANAGVTGSDAGVTGAEPDTRWRADPNRDGELTWARYRGKGRRGRLTLEEQLEEDRRDARYAIAELGKFIRATEVLATPDVLELPAIQRAAARREAAQFLGTAGRQIDELIEKYDT